VIADSSEECAETSWDPPDDQGPTVRETIRTSGSAKETVETVAESELALTEPDFADGGREGRRRDRKTGFGGRARLEQLGIDFGTEGESIRRIFEERGG